jgi:hypothetical protein
MAEKILVCRIGFSDAHHQFPGDEKQVDRGLRVDIAKAEAAIVLVNEVARNFAIGDLLEDGFVGHAGRFQSSD